MTAFLPSNLLALFAPREPIPYFPPLDKLGHQKKPWPYTGIASLLTMFEVHKLVLYSHIRPVYSCINVLIYYFSSLMYKKLFVPLENLRF